MQANKTISVVLADFQFLTRKAIKSLIEDIPGFQVVAQINQPENLMTSLKTVNPQLLVVDIFEKDPSYIDRIIEIKNRDTIEMLVITNSQNQQYIQKLLQAGIRGIVTKNCSEEEITTALKSVSKGQRFYCNNILNQIVEKDTEEDCKPTTLTTRELEVLKLIALGYKTSKIAQNLNISIHTVNSHRKNILRKLNISSPIHLVAYALDFGLVNIEYKKK